MSEENDKAQSVTVKKLTKRNPAMKAIFEALKDRKSPESEESVDRQDY